MLRLALSFVTVASLLSSNPLFPADTIRVCSYNMLKFSYSSGSARLPLFKIVMDSIKPHILIAQEVFDATWGPSFVTDVFSSVHYAAVPFNDGPDTDNGLIYDQRYFEFVDADFIGTYLRDHARYRLRYRGVSADTITIYSVHLKASNTTADRESRAQQIEALIATLPPSGHVLVAGDFNFYSVSESGYVLMTTPRSTVSFTDPLGSEWVRNSTQWHSFYTQSSRVNTSATCGGGVGGGLDDRFDYIFVSKSLEKILVPNSYTHFGNDGSNRLNAPVNDPPNQRVSAVIADALECASDHLPVYADFVLGVTPAAVPARNIKNKSQATVTVERDISYQAPSVVITGLQRDTVICIYNSMGNMLTQQQSLDGSARIDISGVPAGVYFVVAGDCVLQVAIFN